MIKIISLAVMAVLIVTDQLIKHIAASVLVGKDTVVAIPNILGWYYTENTGASFSMFSGKVNFLIVITSLIIIAGFVFLLRKKTKFNLLYIGVSLALTGGIGNLIDRIFRGYVIDYIQTLFCDFPIFNFADCLICIGAGCMIISTIYDLIKEVRSKKECDK